jgi:hypothetical protein
MNHVAHKVAKGDLLKKSIILLKAWFTYESSFLGSYASCMATYALYVLVIFIINNHYEDLKNPLDVFRAFFKYWGAFDWNNNIVTLYAPVKA